MRLQCTSALAALLTLATPALAAQDSYAGALRTMLTQTAAGTCPADLMGEQLLGACTAQIANMRGALAAMGPVTDMKLVKAEGEGEARIETYQVTFTNGRVMNWNIGGLRDGKFDTAGTAR